MKQASILAYTLLAIFIALPAFANDKFEEKKAQALEMITKRLERITQKEACVIGSENMDELKDCKIRIINMLRKTSAKSILQGF